jgi:hypothetical protein
MHSRDNLIIIYYSILTINLVKKDILKYKIISLNNILNFYKFFIFFIL